MDLRCRHGNSTAGRAQRAFLEVDPLRGVGRGHDTAVVVAVSQVQSMSQFMDRLLYYALAKQFAVGRKPIELLTQPVSAGR